MHDIPGLLVFPAVMMAAFSTVAILLPLATIAFFVFARRGFPAGARMAMPLMNRANAFDLFGRAQGIWRNPRDSGNSAFDTYRAETLARLDREAQEFAAFRERLQNARDREEFEHFINEMADSQRG